MTRKDEAGALDSIVYVQLLLLACLMAAAAVVVVVLVVVATVNVVVVLRCYSCFFCVCSSFEPSSEVRCSPIMFCHAAVPSVWSSLSMMSYSTVFFIS